MPQCMLSTSILDHEHKLQLVLHHYLIAFQKLIIFECCEMVQISITTSRTNKSLGIHTICEHHNDTAHSDYKECTKAIVMLNRNLVN